MSGSGQIGVNFGSQTFNGIRAVVEACLSTGFATWTVGFLDLFLVLRNDRGIAVGIRQRYVHIRKLADVVLREWVHEDRHVDG